MTKGRLDCKYRNQHMKQGGECFTPKDVRLLVAKGARIASGKGLMWSLEIFKADPAKYIKSFIEYAFGSFIDDTWICDIPGHNQETLLNLFKNNKCLVSIQLVEFDDSGKEKPSEETYTIKPNEYVRIPTGDGQAINGISYLVKTIEKLGQLYFPCVKVMTVFIQLKIQDIIVKEDEKKIF